MRSTGFTIEFLILSLIQFGVGIDLAYEAANDPFLLLLLPLPKPALTRPASQNTGMGKIKVKDCRIPAERVILLKCGLDFNRKGRYQTSEALNRERRLASDYIALTWIWDVPPWSKVATVADN